MYALLYCICCIVAGFQCTCRLLYSVHFIVGISNFDLLGEFGRQKWLANFYLILVYNAAFGFAATVCLVNKFSASMRQAVYKKVVQAFTGEPRSHSNSMSDSRYFD